LTDTSYGKIDLDDGIVEMVDAVHCRHARESVKVVRVDKRRGVGVGVGEDTSRNILLKRDIFF
jgi:hypothetical protein